MSQLSMHGPGKSCGHAPFQSAALMALAAVVFVGAMTTPASAILVYDRNAAVAYANANYNKVVGDGYYYIDSYPPTYVGAGQPVPGGGNDCAHFVSSAIGSPPGGGGGGLTIPNRAGTYGEPGAARLDELLVGNSAGGYGITYKYGQLVSSVDQLTPGDVIGYDWDGSGGGSMGGIDHTVVYVGNNQIDCHSNSRLKAGWTLGGADNYFFIHITLPDKNLPTTPSNVSPAPNASLHNVTPTLTGNAFSDVVLGSKHVAAQWQVLNGRAGVVYDSGTDTTHLTSLTVPAGKLIIGSTYTWQVRYQDNYGDWSSYSTATTFTTSYMSGDFNHDGLVNAADYMSWRMGSSPTPNSQADYDAWRANFGKSAAGGAGLLLGDLQSAAVPEPSAVFLLGSIAIACVVGRRSRRLVAA